MSIIIKTYSDEFLPFQVKIGREITKDWKYFSQSSEDRLKRVYSQLDFDPTTKFYAFDGPKMVGFQTAKILDTHPVGEKGEKKANLEIPLVIDGNEEIQIKLMNHALQKLKNRGVTVIRTRAGKVWGNTLDVIMKYNYKHIQDIISVAEVNPMNIESSNLIPVTSVIDFNYERDAKELATIFNKLYKQPIVDLLEEYKELENRSISHKIIKDEGKIVGRCVVVRDEMHSNHARLGTPYLDPKTINKYYSKGISLYEYYSEQLVNSAIKECQLKEIVRLQIRNFFSDNTIKKLNQIGINFEPLLSLYKLKL